MTELYESDELVALRNLYQVIRERHHGYMPPEVRVANEAAYAVLEAAKKEVKVENINFGLDWDGCGNTSVETFKKIVKALKRAGYKVYVVTMRYPSEMVGVLPEDFVALIDGLYCTCRKAKGEYMRSIGIPIHIWADDHPETIYKNADQIWGTATPEGQIVSPNYSTPPTFKKLSEDCYIVSYEDSDQVAKAIGEKLELAQTPRHYRVTVQQYRAYVEYALAQGKEVVTTVGPDTLLQNALENTQAPLDSSTTDLLKSSLYSLQHAGESEPVYGENGEVIGVTRYGGLLPETLYKTVVIMPEHLKKD